MVKEHPAALKYNGALSVLRRTSSNDGRELGETTVCRRSHDTEAASAATSGGAEPSRNIQYVEAAGFTVSPPPVQLDVLDDS